MAVSRKLIVLILVLIGSAELSGCAINYQGHEVEQERIESVKVGTTTEQDLLDRFGMPDTIVDKRGEGIRVYQYKDFTSIQVFVRG